MRLLRLLPLLLLCGWGGCGQMQRSAPVADADSQCYQAAVPSTEDSGVRWTCNAEDPKCWDDLGKRVIPALTDKALAGERSRQACVGFIHDLQKQGVIRSKP